MSPQPVYDRWRDAEGTHIPVGAHVEQIEVGKDHGALPSRLRKRGVVTGRGRGVRLTVRFDGETVTVSIRPHLPRVLPMIVESEPVSVARIIAQLEALRDLAARDDR